MTREIKRDKESRRLREWDGHGNQGEEDITLHTLALVPIAAGTKAHEKLKLLRFASPVFVLHSLNFSSATLC